MASPFQVAALVARPSYPNSIAWSDENLVAIASGHLITILNPSLLSGPRGVITIPPNKPFPIGVVSREDLSKGCLMPTCLSRDTRPCARSLSWSRLGLAPNSGCLLALCTLEGRVKIYRQPFLEFSAEWVEVIDISDSLFEHLVDIDFGGANQSSTIASCERVADNHTESGYAGHFRCSTSSKKRKQMMGNMSSERGILEDEVTYVEKNEDANGGCIPPNEKRAVGTEIATFPCLFKKNTPVEVLTHNGDQRVWVIGKIKRINGANALVQYLGVGTSGKKDEWVNLYTQNGVEPGTSSPSPKIRPYMDMCNFPEQISQLELHDMEGIPVEAWLEERWVEGVYVGFDERGLLVKLSGVCGSVTLDARSIRFAPLWNCSLNSWQVTLLKIDLERLKAAEVVEMKSKRTRGKIQQHCSPAPKHGGLSTKKTNAKGACAQITAKQYVSRSAMLTSTIVAWSPRLHASSESDCNSSNCLSSYFSLLAVGGKSGKMSFWRFHEPQEYSILFTGGSVNVMLVGIFEAHNTWITTICWEILSINGLNSQVVLASGSSDGSLRIWLVDTERLLSSSEMDCAAISLLKEVTAASSAPVSVLSTTTHAESPDIILLAVGRGSGLLELWICDISSREFYMSGSYDAHIQVVTGLTWAFNGCCLYSCSQDDSMRCWILRESSLHEAPFPSTSLGLRSSTDLPYVTDSCFGLTMSRGNLVVAAVRGFDAEFLNPMYQARTQKAAVEFFWIGGQELGLSSDSSLEFAVESHPGISETEMLCWEANILWSLKQYEHTDKLLVVWDVIAALFAVKHSAKSYVNRTLFKWISSWFPGYNSGITIKNILLYVSRSLSKISHRRLHLLNIISRRFVLSAPKGNKLEGIDEEDEQQIKLWINLLDTSERELRERLVAFSFVVFLSHTSSSHWLPVGIPQMEKWVENNHGTVHDQLKLLASRVESDKVEESCEFCSSLVPFESPEFAFCAQRHKLPRCAASMKICPMTPLWHCVCCKRSISELVPESLFTISKLPLDLDSLILSSSQKGVVTPLCPFCGILLQRLQPEFLLSPLPV